MNVKPATAKISSLALKHNLQVIKEKAPVFYMLVLILYLSCTHHHNISNNG